MIKSLKKGRTLTIGDIHGRYQALIGVLAKAKVDYENDRVIVLGDIADGGYNTFMVVEELLKIKNLIFVIGNHDAMFMDHMKTGWSHENWLIQGGRATLASYRKYTGLKFPKTHIDFFNKGKYYHVENKMCFVHGGFNPYTGVQYTKKHDLLWDRNLIQYAIDKPVPKFDKVFVGHTTTETFGRHPNIKDCMAPIKFHNLIMMDCGAGYTGKLAIMDVNTEEFWVSRQQKPSSRR